MIIEKTSRKHPSRILIAYSLDCLFVSTSWKKNSTSSFFRLLSSMSKKVRISVNRRRRQIIVVKLVSCQRLFQRKLAGFDHDGWKRRSFFIRWRNVRSRGTVAVGLAVVERNADADEGACRRGGTRRETGRETAVGDARSRRESTTWRCDRWRKA